MASDSEPRKIFFEAPRGPLRSYISGSKKPVRLPMSNDSWSWSWPIATAAAAELHRAHKLIVFSDGTCQEGFLPQCVDDEATPCMHAWQKSFVSPRLSILILSN